MGNEKRDELRDCRRRIAEEEAIARSATSPEAGALHAEMAMLYRVKLDLLKTQRI